MSEGFEALQLKEDDAKKFLASGAHLGAQNVDRLMESYVYKRKSDGIHIINIRKTWEKLMLAARIIAGIENPADVCVISTRPYGTRAVLKFAAATGATPIAGRFTPGTFTNQIQKAFREPRLLVCTDPQFDHQAITEASYVNLPVIALCNTDSPAKYIDVAVPCNNKGVQSIGTMWWMMAREVLYLRGIISRKTPWDVMPDLYFYRDPEEVEKEEQAAAAAAAAQPEETYTTDWNAGTVAPAQPTTTAGADDWETTAPVAPVAAAQDWGSELVQPTEPSKDWGAEPVAAAAPGAEDWGAPAADWGAQPTGTTTDWGATTGDAAVGWD